MVAIGAPGEDVRTRKDAGTALLVGEGERRKMVYTKIGPAPGTAEKGDRFGAAVAFLARPDLDFGYEDHLVVGAPGEDVGTLADAGAARTVTLYRYCEYGCGSDVYPDQAITLIQGKGNTPGLAGSGNHFGATVSRMPGVDRAILVGAPGQTVAGMAGAGAVTVLDPAPTLSHQLDQNTRALPGGSRTGDGFGTLPTQ